MTPLSPTDARRGQRRWTFAEEESIRRLLAEGESIATIAERLGRQVSATKWKAREMKRKGEKRDHGKKHLPQSM